MIVLLNCKLQTMPQQEGRDKLDMGLQVSSMRRGQGFPMPNTAGFGQIQLTHHKAQLSPSAEVGVPLEKVFRKTQNTRQRGGGSRKSEQGQRRRKVGGASGAGAEIALEKTMKKQIVPLQPMEDLMLEQVNTLRELWLMESPCWIWEN